ncbi:MAG: hypothetical protein ISQ34_04555 [Rickettsiales bacterium]|nr:hypothetical protein [Rickettsiales bacterium]
MPLKKDLLDLFTKLNLKKPEDNKNSDQNFIKKDDIPDPEKIKPNTKNNIKPKNNQTRDLDKEVGGLEDEEKKEISSEDVWDNRSEEVDKMGSTQVFNTSGMKSVVWKKKQKRLKKANTQDGFEGMSYVDRVKNLREDRSGANHSHKEGGGGGFSRF